MSDYYEIAKLHPWEHFDFETIFEEYLLAHEKEHKKRKVGNYYPSQLGYCLRQQFLRFFLPNDPNLNSLKVFFCGDMFHDHLLAKVLNWKFGEEVHSTERQITIVIEKDAQTFLRLRGRIDDLIQFKDDHVVLPIEGKSQGAGLKYKKAASPHHIAQLYPYMLAMGADYGYLVYMERMSNPKQDHPYISKTYKIMFDPQHWQMLKRRVITLDDCLRRTLMPEAESHLRGDKKWQCNPSYCAYAFLCVELGEEPVQLSEAEGEENRFADAQTKLLELSEVMEKSKNVD